MVVVGRKNLRSLLAFSGWDEMRNNGGHCLSIARAQCDSTDIVGWVNTGVHMRLTYNFFVCFFVFLTHFAFTQQACWYAVVLTYPSSVSVCGMGSKKDLPQVQTLCLCVCVCAYVCVCVCVFVERMKSKYLSAFMLS